MDPPHTQRVPTAQTTPGRSRRPGSPNRRSAHHRSLSYPERLSSSLRRLGHESPTPRRGNALGHDRPDYDWWDGSPSSNRTRSCSLGPSSVSGASGGFPPIKTKKLLSLDGGGVRGISSLMILQAIMNEVRRTELENGIDDQNERLPCDYFDLAGGSGTGGLSALMLFRLKMSTSDAIKHYEKMTKYVFTGPMENLPAVGDYVKRLNTTISNFFGNGLAVAVNKIVEGYNEGGKDAKLVKGEHKMFLCATYAMTGEAVLFRSYSPNCNPRKSEWERKWYKDATIIEAVEASCAARLHLPYVTIKGKVFYDNGLANNNPINHVWDTRYDLAEHRNDYPSVSLVLSIGTSKLLPASVPETMGLNDSINRLKKHITDSFLTNQASRIAVSVANGRHRDFESKMKNKDFCKIESNKTTYIRLDVTTQKLIDMTDWKRVGFLKRETEEYIKNVAGGKIKLCAEILAKKPSKSKDERDLSEGSMDVD